MGQNPFGGESNSVAGGAGGGGGNYQQHTPQGNGNNNQGFQGVNNNNNFQGAGGNNFQGNGGNNVLPATQGLGANANQNNQGSCPAIAGVPPAEQCTGRLSNCWSVGQADVDCLNNDLCCFDGCANVCQGAGPIQQPAQPPTPARRPATGNNNQNNFASGSNNFNNVAAVPAPRPTPAPKPARRPAPAKPVAAPAPVKPVAAPAKPVQAPAPVNNFQKPAPVNNFQNQNNNNRPANNNNNNNQNAAQKPYVSCPAAMKCVQRQNCDFNGVMTEQVLNLTPELEMLRVPLIPCVNRMRNNNIDVCCRDPNYQDPWPNMQGGGGMKNMQQNNGNNGNQGNNFQNNGNPGNNFQTASGSNALNNQGANSAINPRKQNKKKGYGR